MAGQTLALNGAQVWKGLLNRQAQEALVEDLRAVARAAPFRNYVTPGGKKMSVQMSGAGAVAWTADRRGYRYAPNQQDGQDWPAIPAGLLAIWDQTTGIETLPDSCLVNFYGEGAKMGLHQDRDEAELTWPVVSISLGDEALFRVGQTTRGGGTESMWLQSGDVVVLTGKARLAYHGIDRIKFGTSTLLPSGGRINVTLRVAGETGLAPG